MFSSDADKSYQHTQILGGDIGKVNNLECGKGNINEVYYNIPPHYPN
jgi:hypothetical protein